MGGCLLALGRLQAVDDFLHVLRGVPAHRQHRILGHHQNDVLQPDNRGQHAVAAHVAILRSLEHDIAKCDVTGAIFLAQFPKGSPAAHVGPADIGRYHSGAVGRFGHGVVQADVGAGRELVHAQPDEVQIGMSGLHRRTDGRQHLRRVCLQFPDQGAGGEHEHAGIPQMPARGGERAGGGGVGLFHETRQFMHPGQIGQRRSDLDIAISSFRRGWLHAEGDHAPGPCGGHGSGQRRAQRRQIGDRGIRRHHPQYGIRVFLGYQQRGGGNGRGAVAAHRLQHDPCAFDPGGAQLFGDQEAVFLVADDNRRGEFRTVGPKGGFLDHRPLGYQRPELLGEALT